MEQRRAPRFVVEGIQGTMTSASQVEILNMSISGAAIRLDRNLRVGGEYSLRLELNDTVLAVKGLVVWSVLSEIQKGREDETKPFYSAGMKFKDIGAALGVSEPRISQLHARALNRLRWLLRAA